MEFYYFASGPLCPTLLRGGDGAALRTSLVFEFIAHNALLIGFRNTTPPQNRQLIVLISNSKQYVDDMVGGLTF